MKGTVRDWLLIALFIIGLILVAYVQRQMPPVSPEEAHVYDMPP